MLSADIWCPKIVPTQVKCKNPDNKWWGSAWDANVPSHGPPAPELWPLIGSHLTSAAEAPNMADMAKWAHEPCGRTYTIYMCRPCCRWCSESVARPSWPVNIGHDDASMRLDLNGMIININNDIISSFNNVVLSKVCWLIVVCLKAGSGQWINGYRHDRSMCKFLCCRNRHLPLPLLFLPISLPPRCHTGVDSG